MTGKSTGVDNIPAELVQAYGGDVTTALRTICNKIWQKGKWPTPWAQSLVIIHHKKGNLQQCNNYRIISLISHPSKLMLKIVLNRLKPQAEKIIAEEQTGFRAGRSKLSTNESSVRNISSTRPLSCLHILPENLPQGLARSFIGNHEEVQHQRQLSPSHQHLYGKATSAVLFNGSIRD